MGKYSKLKGQYDQAPVGDPSFVEKVNEVRGALPYRQQPEQLAINYRTLYNQKKELEAQIRELNVKLMAHDQEMVNWLETAGLTQFKTDDGDTVFIKDEPYTSVENREAFINWIKETQQEDLLTVHYQTMNSMVKDRLTNGENPPPGLKVFIKSGINLRKGSK